MYSDQGSNWFNNHDLYFLSTWKNTIFSNYSFSFVVDGFDISFTVNKNDLLLHIAAIVVVC